MCGGGHPGGRHLLVHQRPKFVQCRSDNLLNESSSVPGSAGECNEGDTVYVGGGCFTHGQCDVTPNYDLPFLDDTRSYSSVSTFKQTPRHMAFCES